MSSYLNKITQSPEIGNGKLAMSRICITVKTIGGNLAAGETKGNILTEPVLFSDGGYLNMLHWQAIQASTTLKKVPNEIFSSCKSA